MEKKIISIEQRPNGEQRDALVEQCLEERVNQKIALLYKHYYDFQIDIRSEFIVNIQDDEVKSMTLTYKVAESPNHVDKYCLETTCYMFFNLNFKTCNDGTVSLHADNMFDMAQLMQALISLSIDMTCWYVPIDINKTVEDARAIVNQNRLEELQITESEEVDMEYDETPCIIDEHHVAYSLDGKKLLWARTEFDETEYRVPDGVEEIANDAFLFCHIPVRLIVPHTVKRIGFDVFGYNGGHIEIISE